MTDWLGRTESLIGAENVRRLTSAAVAVFGVGGVGGYCVEALARAGVGRITAVDFDTIDETNINRQLLADTGTVGRPKAELACERILRINPKCDAEGIVRTFSKETSCKFGFDAYNCVIDAMDSVSAKVELAVCCKAAGVKLFACMGTGNRTEAEFRVADVYFTSGDPLAKAMRKAYREAGIDELTVVYSPSAPAVSERPPASISYVPGIAGLTLAGEAIKHIISAGVKR